MIQPLFNWRTGLAIIAIAIVSGTILYSTVLAKKIAAEERQKAEQWAEAGKLLVSDTSGISTPLVSLIITGNNTLPIIWTDENDRIVQFANLDSASVASDTNYVRKQLEEFKTLNPPIVWEDPGNPDHINRYYYGHTSLLNQVRYYPYVQLFLVALFIIITVTALTTNFRSTQNQVWAGMAKETAHQMGTPLSSLEGWVEMLKESGADPMMVAEMSKDVDRLRLVSDRFGKIGSIPNLEEREVSGLVVGMQDYIKKRAPGKVQFILDFPDKEYIAPVSAPLFDWVIENLLKNALDAMEGKGAITITMENTHNSVIIDVSDTGKGIPRSQFNTVFKPGFTTKKRGWGLGLSLCKRIIEQYHKGQLFVKTSEIGKGTTFRVILNK
ncbi:MAG: HAMP domain-containing histidine kinase [Chitinophagaceae bacterium]|uniref:sensor histidine kinase n=1 Tax=unclassified Paraflavitalea TaxID=2798305 RepID=UPI003D326024|nr:HAMP domain-containing histidine kinase [Chitinophagaceae bacterium]